MDTFIRVAVRSSFMLTTANSAAFNIVRNQFAAVQPILWISSSLVPARQFQTTVGTRDIGLAAKFIGAGACTVGIAGSGAGSVYRSLIIDYARNRSLGTSLGQACHYTTDETDQHAKNIDGVDFSKMSKEEVILYFGRKVGTLETQLDALKGMLGTVGGRGIVDKFFSVHVKPYAVVKDPGTSYTGAEIRRAYENFLKDSKNPVAIALLKYFPNESVRDVAKRYQKLYGKISWYDHTLYEALIKMLTIEQFINTIQSIPAFLLTKEKYSLEKMIEVFIEFKDDYQT